MSSRPQASKNSFLNVAPAVQAAACRVGYAMEVAGPDTYPRDSLTSLKRRAGHCRQHANQLNRKSKRLPVNEMKHALFAQACNNRITFDTPSGKIIVAAGAHPYSLGKFARKTALTKP